MICSLHGLQLYSHYTGRDPQHDVFFGTDNHIDDRGNTGEALKGGSIFLQLCILKLIRAHVISLCVDMLKL